MPNWKISLSWPPEDLTRLTDQEMMSAAREYMKRMGYVNTQYIVIEPGKRGAQIDLLIDHKDGYINLCEMKFSKKEYSIDRKDKEDLENKIEAFQSETKTRQTVLLTMVTTFGVKANAYSDIVQKTVVLDDLF